jgi:hypothetical protein
MDFWNGEEDSFVSLGMVGLANMAVLESLSTNGGSYHLRWLSAAPGKSSDARVALSAISSLGSPSVYADAVSALTGNAAVSDPDYRAMVAYLLSTADSKNYFAAPGVIRTVDFAHPPTLGTLVSDLKSAPGKAFRATAVDLYRRFPASAQPSDIDKVLTDDRYDVRLAAAALFWKGTDTSSARQASFLAWFGGAEAKAQYRKAILPDDTGWAPDLPAEVILMAETIAMSTLWVCSTRPEASRRRMMLR